MELLARTSHRGHKAQTFLLSSATLITVYEL
jgi:hypothetical protein